jgi:hypothetical protein
VILGMAGAPSSFGPSSTSTTSRAAS